MLIAGVENIAGEILLSTNPSDAGRLICLCEVLHAGAVIAVKSPARIRGVGTKEVLVVGAVRMSVLCSPAKKKSLFLRIGPPMVPPNWLRLSWSTVVAKVLRALTMPLRMN